MNCIQSIKTHADIFFFIYQGPGAAVSETNCSRKSLKDGTDRQIIVSQRPVSHDGYIRARQIARAEMVANVWFSPAAAG